MSTQDVTTINDAIEGMENEALVQLENYNY